MGVILSLAYSLVSSLCYLLWHAARAVFWPIFYVISTVLSWSWYLVTKVFTLLWYSASVSMSCAWRITKKVFIDWDWMTFAVIVGLLVAAHCLYKQYVASLGNRGRRRRR